VLFSPCIIIQVLGESCLANTTRANYRKNRNSLLAAHDTIDRSLKSVSPANYRKNRNSLASDLDSHVLRSSARGGGDTQGPDHFSSFGFRVFSAFLGALTSNSRFISARVLKGPLCNLYPPCVMNEWFSGVFYTPPPLFKKTLSQCAYEHMLELALAWELTSLLFYSIRPNAWGVKKSSFLSKLKARVSENS
jgi:hypothetical protein